MIRWIAQEHRPAFLENMLSFFAKSVVSCQKSLRPARYVIPFLMGAIAQVSAAGDGMPYSHKDWELACDNTRTCRAAGYQSEDGKSDPVSILLTRPAGPATEVGIDLRVGGEDEVKGPLRLKVGPVDIAGLAGDPARLQPEQARRLLPELLRNEQAAVTAAGGKRWTVSLAGLNAVLLKMDEIQGRLGTPSALIRRGGKAESSVPPGLPIPVVTAVLPAKPRPTDAALGATIFPSLDLRQAKEDCNPSQPLNADAAMIERLTEASVLVSLSCGTGAYNEMNFLWIANDKAPHAPRAVKAHGEFNPADGSVSAFYKGRGVADCGSIETAHFDGKDFVRSTEAGDSLCRGFGGGAWSLPRYVSRVVMPSRR
jgi:hypothetical protein